MHLVFEDEISRGFFACELWTWTITSTTGDGVVCFTNVNVLVVKYLLWRPTCEGENQRIVVILDHINSWTLATNFEFFRGLSFQFWENLIVEESLNIFPLSGFINKNINKIIGFHPLLLRIDYRRGITFEKI